MTSAVLTIAIVIVMCLAQYTSSFAKPLPGYARRIAFYYVEPGNTEREDTYPMIMNLDTSESILLTSAFPADYESVKWSPDGKRLVHDCNVGEGEDICTVNVDGSNPIRVTRNPGIDDHFMWLSNGERIGYMSDRGNNYGQIYTIRWDGSDDKLVNGELNEVALWSPDEKKIATYRTNSNGKSQIFILDKDGQNATNISNSQTDDGFDYWSPDSKTIFYLVYEGTHSHIWRMNADGSNKMQLTDTLEGEYLLAVSHSGKELVFSREGKWDPNYPNFSHNVYLMDINGRDIRYVFNERYVKSTTFSPDDRFLAIWDGIQIYIVDLQCSETASDCNRVTTVVNTNRAYALSPAAWEPLPKEQ